MSSQTSPPVATWGHDEAGQPVSDIQPTVPSSAQEPFWAAPGGPQEVEAPSRGTPVRAMVVLGLLVVVAVAVPLAIISHLANQYYVFSPGTAPLITTDAGCTSRAGSLALPDGQPCVLLQVPQDKAHALTGQIHMVDVLEQVASPWQWIEARLGVLGSDRQMQPIAWYLGSVPVSEAGCQDAQEMSESNQAAALAALSVLSYKVQEVPLGAQVQGVNAHSPAWAAGIRCNDIITAVDGKPVSTDSQLSAQLSPIPAGTVVRLTDKAAGQAKARQVLVKAAPRSQAPAGFQSQAQAYFGLQFGTLVRTVLPFKVSVNAGDIGGPSAGLAFTLAILDTLSNGNLTGGHRVAATGEITPNGAVEPVGGVQEKTVAVQDAGAQVFFVPASEYSQAEPEAKKGMTVVPVSTLSQVLKVLHSRYGGDLSGIKALDG